MRAPPDADVQVIGEEKAGGNANARTNWTSDGAPQQFRDQGAWVLKDQRCQGQARLRVRGGGQRGKMRGSLGGECRYVSDLIGETQRGQTSDGALAHAAFTAGNGDDPFHVRNGAFGRKAAARHYRGFTLLGKTLRGEAS